MGKASPIVVGDHSFPTKAAAKVFFGAMLGRYKAGDRVSDADAKWLHGLIALHPDADDKIRGGIAYFSVKRNQFNNGFWLHRLDGSPSDWSYLDCISHAGPEQQALDGFRNAVGDTIVAYLSSHGHAKIGSQCPLSGILITAENMQIAHVLPFRDIVRAFLVGEGLELSQVTVMPSTDRQTMVRLADNALRERWHNYHKSNAVVMVATDYGNRHRPKGVSAAGRVASAQRW
jgi:hypothetical protein